MDRVHGRLSPRAFDHQAPPLPGQDYVLAVDGSRRGARIAALALTGQDLSVRASVGFIALFGIALENGMMLVTYLNQLIGKGMDLDEASVHGACLCLRPVLMIAATTALGLIPLLLATITAAKSSGRLQLW